MATPLFEAAGLEPNAVRVMLVQDRSLNAFVSGGQNVFIHTGLLVRADSANQLLGVLAHETGHMAGGHLARMPEVLREAMIVSLLESVVAMAGMAAAAGQNNNGLPRDRAPQPIVGSGRPDSVALRTLFSFTRAQESAADQAGVAYLDTIGQSSRGFLQFMEILANQEALSSTRQDPYLRTHPMSQDRVSFLREHVARSPYSTVATAPEIEAMYQRMRAKLIGYLEPAHIVAQRYPANDQSVNARYARAFAAYRTPDPQTALRLMDELIKERPDDPYFREFRGQILFETGRAVQAVPEYREAVRLAPDQALLKIDLAQALLEMPDRASRLEAQKLLQDASRIEGRMSRLWRLLAVAYGRDGQEGMAAVALSEQALIEGRLRDARDQARKAVRLLPEGSPGWLRAQDLETEAQRLREQELNR